MISVQQVFGQIVSVTSAAIMPTVIANLTAVRGNIPKETVINYQYGHDKEISTKIAAWTKSSAKQYLNFPLIWMREDISFDIQGELQYVNIPSLVIAVGTQATYESKERETYSFNPVLRPIYYALIDAIYSGNGGHFRIADPTINIPHRRIEHKFWGTPEDEQAKSVFQHYVDSIELQNLRLLIEPSCDMIID